MSALLDVRELTTVFRSRGGEVRAVDGVSYEVEAGRSLAIVGESGSGKSVSALSVLRLVPSPGEVVSGKVLFDDRDLLGVSETEIRQTRGRDIAMVFQDPMTSLNPVLSIGTQLTESLRWHEKMPLADAQTRAVEVLELVGIPDARRRLDDYPHQFSGGQRQRIMIAMAIICRPALLIADEPTTALDVTIQAQIVDLIAELQEKLRMAVIWITHDLALIAGVADDVAVMYAGSIVEYGPVGDVFDKPRHPYTIGLLDSMPRFDRDRRERLASIDGAPPDLARLPAGCPFAPRCDRRKTQCTESVPALDGGRHRTACWMVDPV
jgi:oligopeptide transport system ATP-binding protein